MSKGPNLSVVWTSGDVLWDVVADVYPQDGVLVDVLSISRVQVRSHHDHHVSLLALGGLHRPRNHLDVLLLDLNKVGDLSCV